MTENTEGYARRYISYVTQICNDVANGLDPVSGMYKVRAWEAEQEEPMPEKSKLPDLVRAVRDLLAVVGSPEEADKYGVGSIFSESVSWVTALNKLSNQQEEMPTVQAEPKNKKID